MNKFSNTETNTPLDFVYKIEGEGRRWIWI